MGELLEEIAMEYEVPVELLRQLIEREQERVHLARRKNITTEIIEILTQYTTEHQ